MNPSRYERALRRILFELRPYRDEIVVIGGWVPYLYRRYGGFLMEREHLADGRGGRADGPPVAAT